MWGTEAAASWGARAALSEGLIRSELFRCEENVY